MYKQLSVKIIAIKQHIQLKTGWGDLRRYYQ
jgi:hypothetical protein